MSHEWTQLGAIPSLSGSWGMCSSPRRECLTCTCSWAFPVCLWLSPLNSFLAAGYFAFWYSLSLASPGFHFSSCHPLVLWFPNRFSKACLLGPAKASAHRAAATSLLNDVKTWTAPLIGVSFPFCVLQVNSDDGLSPKDVRGKIKRQASLCLKTGCKNTSALFSCYECFAPIRFNGSKLCTHLPKAGAWNTMHSLAPGCYQPLSPISILMVTERNTALERNSLGLFFLPASTSLPCYSSCLLLYNKATIEKCATYQPLRGENMSLLRDMTAS